MSVSPRPLSGRPRLRIGTRKSPLALWQAEAVRDALLQAHQGLAAADVELVPLSTRGDELQSAALRDFGGKGLFTESIDKGLKDHSLDLAVHSAKDLPTVLPDGLVLTAVLPRADARDAFISLHATSLLDLSEGAAVGTASLRRGAQILALRPDLRIVTFRGNVQTRLRKLEEGQVDATLLAMAGLSRLNMGHVATEVLDVGRMLPAVGQGVIAIESRAEDRAVADLLAPLNCVHTYTALLAERAFLARLDGSCRTPIAAYAVVDGDQVRLEGRLLSPDGSQIFTARRAGSVEQAAALGSEAGQQVKDAAGADFFANLPG